MSGVNVSPQGAKFHILHRMMVKWLMREVQNMRGGQRNATHGLGRLAIRQLQPFAHWLLSEMHLPVGQEELDELRGARADL